MTSRCWGAFEGAGELAVVAGVAEDGARRVRRGRARGRVVRRWGRRMVVMAGRGVA